MKFPWSAKQWIVASIVAAVIGSAWGISAVRVNQDNNKVKKMTQKMKTVCVGRLLIDLPEETEVRFSSAQIAGVTINVEPNFTDEKLKLEIEQRESKLSNEKNEYGLPSLEKKLIVDAINFKSTILYFARTKPGTFIEYGKLVQGTEQGISIESLGVKDNNLHHFSAIDLASPRSQNNVLDLVTNFEARTAESIPTAPGFCIENGLVRDPLTPDDNEYVAMFASLKGHPDIAIRLSTSINVKDMEEPLLVREEKNDIKRDYAANFKSLRKGVRMLNGIHGEEVGDKVKELNGTSAHSFMWVGLGKMRDVLAPSITLELQTGKGRAGKPRNSSLSDEAVLQLWDSISSSLRLRPTSTKTDAAAPAIPLGESVVTGSRCPQTGYWECKEAGKVEGGQRRLFITGEDMPYVTVRNVPNLWQRLRGEQPVHRVKTIWKLVDYKTSLPEQAGVADSQMSDSRNASEGFQEDGHLDGQIRSGPNITDSDRSQS
jgi:hypothetical protein